MKSKKEIFKYSPLGLVIIYIIVRAFFPPVNDRTHFLMIALFGLSMIALLIVLNKYGIIKSYSKEKQKIFVVTILATILIALLFLL
jgi:hypothetical protein